MKVLAIETATAVCGAAVVTEKDVLAEENLFDNHIHSEKLLTIIDTVQKRAGDCDVIAVSIGPGSFTGLRIGLSVAKGLAFSQDKPLVAIPTLEALAQRAVLEGTAGENDEVIAMIDARRNDAYAASYTVQRSGMSGNWGPEALSLEILVSRFPEHGRIVLMGDAVAKLLQRHGAILQNDLRFRVPPIEHRLCSAVSVGMLGVQKALRNDCADRATLEPLYVKEFATLVHHQHVPSQDG